MINYRNITNYYVRRKFNAEKFPHGEITGDAKVHPMKALDPNITVLIIEFSFFYGSAPFIILKNIQGYLAYHESYIFKGYITENAIRVRGSAL